MSQFGVMLLMFAIVIGLVGLIKFLAWLTELQEQGGIGVAIGRGVSRYVVRHESVKPSQVIMSLSAPVEPVVRTGSADGSQLPNHPHAPDTYQVEPPEPVSCEPVREPPAISHKMSRKELTVVLAVQKDSDGSYRFSANKIAEFVGGTRQETLDLIAEARGTKAPEPTPVATAASTLRRPAGGW